MLENEQLLLAILQKHISIYLNYSEITPFFIEKHLVVKLTIFNVIIFKDPILNNQKKRATNLQQLCVLKNSIFKFLISLSNKEAKSGISEVKILVMANKLFAFCQ